MSVDPITLAASSRGRLQRIKNLRRMLSNLAAHGLDRAFRHYVSIAHQHDLIRDDVHFVKNVAGDQ